MTPALDERKGEMANVAETVQGLRDMREHYRLCGTRYADRILDSAIALLESPRISELERRVEAAEAEVGRLHHVEAAACAVTAHCPVNDINYTSVPTHKLRDLLAALRLSATPGAHP